MVPFNFINKLAGLQRSAAFAGDDERQVLAGVFVAVLKSRTPHHDAIVEQRAIAFLQAVHLLHHVRELRDVEGRDRGDFIDLVFFVVVMRLRMMLAFETEFRIRHAVGRGTDVGADARRVRLEGQHVQVAHDLHVFAAFVAIGDFDLDRRRVWLLALARADAGLFQRRLFLPEFDPGDAPLHGPNRVKVFVELLRVIRPELFAQVARAADDQIEHRAVQRIALRERARLVGCAEEPVQHRARIDLRR